MVSCNDNNEDYYKNSIWRVGTVENENLSKIFDIKLDADSSIVKVVKSDYYNNYIPENGQRIYACYTTVDETTNPTEVKLLNLYEMLTKEIFDITPETQDSIGNDPILINEIWMSNDYLNVKFSYISNGHITHFINLVADKEKNYNDNKVHLEFRHNANKDFTGYLGWGLASFNLKSLQNAGANSPIELAIHVNDGSQTDKIYNLSYNFENLETGIVTNISAKEHFLKVK